MWAIVILFLAFLAGNVALAAPGLRAVSVGLNATMLLVLVLVAANLAPIEKP